MPTHDPSESAQLGRESGVSKSRVQTPTLRLSCAYWKGAYIGFNREWVHFASVQRSGIISEFETQHGGGRSRGERVLESQKSLPAC
jgi:hypothetical protein